MSEQGIESPQPAPTNETSDTQENKEILKHLTSRRSRLLHATVDAKFFLPSEDTITEEDINKLKQKNPEEIDFRAVNAVSEDSRKEAWRGEELTFDEKKSKWNDSVRNWVEKNTKEDADDREVRKETLAIIGIDVDKEGELRDKVEGFRQKYVGDRTSDIKTFVQDIAEGCGQPPDLDKLEERLSSVKELLNVFGKNKSVNMLVEEYAMTRGILLQDEPVKHAYAKQAKNITLTEPADREAFDALAHKNMGIAFSESIATPEQNTPQSTIEEDRRQKAEDIEKYALTPAQNADLGREYTKLIEKKNKGKLSEEDQKRLDQIKIEEEGRSLKSEDIKDLEMILVHLNFPKEEIDKVVKEAEEKLREGKVFDSARFSRDDAGKLKFVTSWKENPNPGPTSEPTPPISGSTTAEPAQPESHSAPNEQSAPKTGPAIWRHKDFDMPIDIARKEKGPDGKDYYITKSGTGIPADEVEWVELTEDQQKWLLEQNHEQSLKAAHEAIKQPEQPGPNEPDKKPESPQPTGTPESQDKLDHERATAEGMPEPKQLSTEQQEEGGLNEEEKQAVYEKLKNAQTEALTQEEFEALVAQKKELDAKPEERDNNKERHRELQTKFLKGIVYFDSLEEFKEAVDHLKQTGEIDDEVAQTFLESRIAGPQPQENLQRKYVLTTRKNSEGEYVFKADYLDLPKTS